MSNEEIEEMIKDADSNLDGRIHYEDFVKMMI